ncbi:hypothetical protein [Campylobacter sp. US33a]|uniref:hypothetical protein n=1 Tax=Campylobacter sp. US33a TaxID=2498120 RepID=UPI0010679680|nr:hypothetical protein [Campylobacter sp. US33a]TEY02016.1 hypothetical protein ELQ16_06590 [Campylobacter sp. US33a]
MQIPISLFYVNIKEGLESFSGQDLILISNEKGISSPDGKNFTQEQLDSLKEQGSVRNLRSFYSLETLNSSDYEIMVKDTDQDGIDEELVINIPNGEFQTLTQMLILKPKAF